MIFNAKMLSGKPAKDSEGKKKNSDVVLLSGLSRSVKGNESPAWCEWAELTPKIKCKQRLSVQFSCAYFFFLLLLLFPDTLLILSGGERLQVPALKGREEKK